MSTINVVLRLMKAAVEFVWWWGLHSNFHVKPNYSVEVVLRCVVVGVVTIEFVIPGSIPKRGISLYFPVRTA